MKAISFAVWFIALLALLCLAAAIYGAMPAAASGSFCESVEHCVDLPKPRCVKGYDWRFFIARDPKCKLPVVGEDTRAYLCYVGGDGKPQRWKMLRWQPAAEARFEAQMRNEAQCR